MTKDEIIRMAREADLVAWLPNSSFSDGVWWIEAHEVGSELEQFAKLVAEHERKQIIASNATEIDKINAHIKALEVAVLKEREACAELIPPQYFELRDRIRARGDKHD